MASTGIPGKGALFSLERSGFSFPFNSICYSESLDLANHMRPAIYEGRIVNLSQGKTEWSLRVRVDLDGRRER